MRKLGILLAGMLVTCGAFATDWIWVGNSKSGDNYYIDYDYYKYNKTLNSTDLWFKIEEKGINGYFVEQKSLNRYYCDSKETRVLSAIYYLPSGDLKSMYSDNYLAKTNTVFPDTTGETLWDVACGTPAKGLDFKYPNLLSFTNYSEYTRSIYAYLRLKQQTDINYINQLTPSIQIENYEDYSQYIEDVKKERAKIRLENIQKIK